MDRRTGTTLGFLLLLLFLVLFVYFQSAQPISAVELDSDQSGLVIPRDTPGDLSEYAGRKVSAFGARVTSVDADEGFWVDADGRRVWVQLETLTESSYTVEPGQVVSFTGTVVTHEANWPDLIDFCPDRHDSHAELSRQGAHVSVPVDALTFGVG